MTNAKRIVAAGLIALGLLALTGCGGGSGQTVNCTRYLDCVVKLGGSSASLDSKFGPAGTCWMDSASADACDKQCKTSLAAFPGDAGC